MIVREIKKNELDYLWEFEKENRKYDEKVLGKKFWPFYISDINEKEKEEWLKDLKKSFQEKNTKIFVVEENEKLLGYTWISIYTIDYLNPPKKAGYIHELFITEKARGRKLATELMNKAFNWFKENNIEFVSLCIFAQNKEVVEVYKKFGFEPFNLFMRKKM